MKAKLPIQNENQNEMGGESEAEGARFPFFWIELRAGIPPPSCTCPSRYSRDSICRTVGTTSWKCLVFSSRVRVRVRVGVIVRGEKCVLEARNVEQLKNFFLILRSSTVPKSSSSSWSTWKFNDFRWRVGCSNLGYAILFISTLVFFSKWRLRKISKSHRQKRASPDMREHTLMTF